jgi:stage II sporulation protein D
MNRTLGVRSAVCGLLSAVSVALSFVPSATAQPNPEWIRVAVVREDPQVELQVYGRFVIRTLHTGSPLQEGRRLPAVAVQAVPEGLAIGGRLLPVAGVRIEPASEAALSLNGRRLRGTLEIVRQRDMTLLVVNHVALEDYLRGVLSKEAPDYWPPEALKAIAIAARTYAVYQRLTKAPADYDVTGDVMSQDYGGKSEEKIATTRAVKATAGLILTHQGRLFPTFYHSTCGGMTEHARVMGDFDLVPLRGGIACTLCAASPFFRWQRRLAKADLSWALRKSRYGSIGAVAEMRVSRRTASGRVQELVLAGAQRTLRLSGYDVRQLLGFERIRSPLFTVTPVADGFLLDGRGWGHGVGMCQWGAAELARRGFSAAEILAFYYPGVALAALGDVGGRPIEVIGGAL